MTPGRVRAWAKKAKRDTRGREETERRNTLLPDEDDKSGRPVCLSALFAHRLERKSETEEREGICCFVSAPLCLSLFYLSCELVFRCVCCCFPI